jgi:hypothetical protein
VNSDHPSGKSVAVSHGQVGKTAMLAAFFAAFALCRADASALDWLRSNQKTTRPKSARVETLETQKIQLNSLEQNTVSGNNLDPYQFAQSHFSGSRARLEKACRAISSRYNDAAVRDILQKLFVIDTQLFKESIKTSALSVKEIISVNDAVSQGIQDLNRVITAPGQETLENLDKSIDQVGAANLSQSLLVKKYLTASEHTISMAQAGYETLELIPSLSLPALDMLVQMSKQLMRITQSNSEAFKGLLLNVQSSTETVASGLENIKKTVRETLRFSDHFAVRQFPLINLPAPSREKIFVQLSSIANSVRGVENTVAIGDSQVRNTAQQFTHLTGGFVAKAAESMKYQAAESSEKAVEQISTYARNQVSGLFLRIKEDIAQMRTSMAKAARPTAANVPPAVNFESRDEYASRRAQSASSEKLPLFLLGGANEGAEKIAGREAPQVAAAEFDRRSETASENGFIALNKMAGVAQPAMPKVGSTQVLYREDSFSEDESGLQQPEMNILSQELGSDFFFGPEGENQSAGSIMAKGSAMPSFGEEEEDEGFSDDGGNSDMQMSYGNLGDSGEPEIEMLRLDSASVGNDSEDLIPMMRYDSEILNLEE